MLALYTEPSALLTNMTFSISQAQTLCALRPGTSGHHPMSHLAHLTLIDRKASFLFSEELYGGTESNKTTTVILRAFSF